MNTNGDIKNPNLGPTVARGFQRPKARLPVGKSIQFKFPPTHIDPKIQRQYAERKVRLINPTKFMKVLTMNPANQFQGTLKLF